MISISYQPHNGSRSGVVLCLLLLCCIPKSVLAAAICNNPIPATTPTLQFTDNLDDNGDPDGTVTDNNTGLMWARCTLDNLFFLQSSVTLCSGSHLQLNWKQAIERQPIALVAAGHTDWRLPNIKEMQTIVERQCHLPAMNEVLFPSNPELRDCYWTSTPSSTDGAKAWYVDFHDGTTSIDEKIRQCGVRLVRG